MDAELNVDTCNFTGDKVKCDTLLETKLSVIPVCDAQFISISSVAS